MNARTLGRAILFATLINVRSTSSGSSPGRMRQFTLAAARCGSAFGACPASTIVATQVVRSIAL